MQIEYKMTTPNGKWNTIHFNNLCPKGKDGSLLIYSSKKKKKLLSRINAPLYI